MSTGENLYYLDALDRNMRIEVTKPRGWAYVATDDAGKRWRLYWHSRDPAVRLLDAAISKQEREAK